MRAKKRCERCERTNGVSGASERTERATEWPVKNAIVTSRNRLLILLSDCKLTPLAGSVHSDLPPHKIDEWINTAIEGQIIEQIDGVINGNCDEQIDEVVVDSQPEKVQVTKYKVTQYVTVYTNMKLWFHSTFWSVGQSID